MTYFNTTINALYGTSTSTAASSPNPSLFALIPLAILFHGATFISEAAIVAGEAVLAPMTPTNPLLIVPLELTLAAAGIVVLDLDVAFMSYTYRVATDPNQHQEFEILPPWGFDS